MVIGKQMLNTAFIWLFLLWNLLLIIIPNSKKEEAEKEATEKLINELPPHLSQLLERYEKQIEPEARFVRFVDKMLPAIINIMAGEAGTFKQDYGIYTLEAIQSGYAERMEKLQSMFPEFDFILLITGLIEQTSQQSLFGTKE
jgi:hypothetical protein